MAAILPYLAAGGMLAATRSREHVAGNFREVASGMVGASGVGESEVGLLAIRERALESGVHELGDADRQLLSAGTAAVISKRNLSRELAINRIRDALRNGGMEGRA